MPVSKHRKKHKTKIKQRGTKIKQARNTYNKFMQMRMAMMQKAQEESKNDAPANGNEPVLMGSTVPAEATAAEPTVP